ncbi:hypothetical protein CGS54_00305 [Faecalibacterium prausnitzii]|uniref:InlB B-repeat-containing protein n=1 Tax=Faecalibacterium prausnitzii TaxID=853 RepID=UPI000BEBA38C|nr:hypothetical protein [Faecalibacterium prausnitzii]PDX70758.1 hypothetical protein CGS54_00305 [Faecalibacterium prausnitzii]
MKQGKLIRRAVSAALAGCMMFTLSAPALAESTDALMQLSMTRRSAVSVLDAENGVTVDYGITVTHGEKAISVTSANCGNILGNGTLSYDPAAKKLTYNGNNGTITGELTIDAPNVDVELTGNSSIIDGYSTNLNIKNARNVTLSTNNFPVVGGMYGGNVEINCSGKLTIKNSDFTWSAIQGDLTVHNALEILVEGLFSTVVGGDVKIECACPATFKNNQNGGIARSITYAGEYVYYTSDAADAEAVDPNVTSIPAKTAKYVRIVPKVSYTITADGATITVDGKVVNSAFAGEKVTVTAAGRKNAEFTGWTDLDSVLTSDQLTAKEVTFTMPDKNVTLTPNYKQYYTITSTDDVTIKVDNDRSTATAKALEGQHIVALANNKDGYVFENWEVDGVTLNTSNSVNYTNFEMPAKNVTLTPHYAKLHTIEVVNGTANITSAKKGTKVTVTADDRPGYVFDHWESEQIRLTTSEATNPSLTFAMPDEDVVLKAVPKTLYTITVEGGTVNNAVSARVKSGDPVTVVPEDKGADWKFIEWEVINAPENFSIDTSNPALQFNMPVGNVTLKAVQMRYRTITVNNGLGQTVKTDALRGETYTFTADKLEGQRFDYWEVTDPDGTRNLMDETINITVPKGNITLTAHYKTLYTITVDGKTIGTAAVGDTVHIKADLPEDRKFSRWEGNVSLNGHEEDSEFDLVITEGKNVELTSVTTQRYYIIIIDANGETKTEAEAGSTYSIKAAGRDGWDFTGWVVDNADVVRQLDLTKADNQAFVMPTGTDVTITATYKKQRTVTVIGGTVNGNDSVTALREETVEIKAEYDPYEKKFNHWEVKGPKGWDLEDDQKTNPEFTLTVPKGNVTLTAVYNDYHNITVEGGYATPDRAIAGTQITLTPDLPEDQEFDYWYSTDINLREDQRGNPNLTFKMRDFDIKITAVPKQLYFVDLEDADTTANGEDTRVEVKTGEEVVLVAPEREGFRFNHWEVTSGTVGLIDADKTTAYFTMKSENVKIKAIYDEYHTITMVDGKGTAYNADGKEITSAVVGDKITIVAKDRDSHEFNHWEIDPDNVILEDPNAERTYFTMPDEAVKVKAKYKHLQSITMNHGTAYDEDFSETDIAKAKQTITIKAEDRYADGLVFDHWAVDTDNVILADEHGEKTTFEMVNGPVELTAHYKARVTVFSVPAKFEEGIGEHSDETWEKVGETATITAKIDEETFPGMEFDYWEVIPTDLDIGNIHSQTISFEVPECEVKLVAHWKASGMNPIVDPDEDLDPGFGVETESSDGGAGGAGAAIAGVAIGGAAVWGGYEIATRVILHGLLPEGAAIPANRGQLALLIWTEKGKPEPAAQPAFADITDAEQAKAAQWCVEQGLLDAREGKFESDGWMPKFKTIEIWNKAFPKK